MSWTCSGLIYGGAWPIATSNDLYASMFLTRNLVTFRYDSWFCSHVFSGAGCEFIAIGIDHDGFVAMSDSYGHCQSPFDRRPKGTEAHVRGGRHVVGRQLALTLTEKYHRIKGMHIKVCCICILSLAPGAVAVCACDNFICFSTAWSAGAKHQETLPRWNISR